MPGYRAMTIADLAEHLSRAADDKTRWKLVWEFLEEYRGSQMHGSHRFCSMSPLPPGPAIDVFLAGGLSILGEGARHFFFFFFLSRHSLRSAGEQGEGRPLHATAETPPARQNGSGYSPRNIISIRCANDNELGTLSAPGRRPQRSRLVKRESGSGNSPERTSSPSKAIANDNDKHMCLSGSEGAGINGGTSRRQVFRWIQPFLSPTRAHSANDSGTSCASTGLSSRGRSFRWIQPFLAGAA